RSPSVWLVGLLAARNVGSMYRPMERSSDRNRPAIAAPAAGMAAGAAWARLGWNASTTSGFPKIMHVQIPKTSPISQPADQGTMARMAAVATSGYQRSRRIMTAPVMIRADSGTSSDPARITVGQNESETPALSNRARARDP